MVGAANSCSVPYSSPLQEQHNNSMVNNKDKSSTTDVSETLG